MKNKNENINLFNQMPYKELDKLKIVNISCGICNCNCNKCNSVSKQMQIPENPQKEGTNIIVHGSIGHYERYDFTVIKEE